MKNIVIISLFLLSIVNVNAGSKLSIGNPIDTIGVAQKSSIFPNPAITYTQIKTNDINLKIKYISVFSMVGNEVISLNGNNANSTYLNVMKLNKGRYLVRVQYSDDSQEVLNLMKN